MNHLENLENEFSEEDLAYEKFVFDVTVRINEILSDRGINKRNLSMMLSKQPSEVQKWLKGDHNFTLKTLIRLEQVLGEKIINVVSKDYTRERNLFEFYHVTRLVEAVNQNYSPEYHRRPRRALNAITTSKKDYVSIS